MTHQWPATMVMSNRYESKGVSKHTGVMGVLIPYPPRLVKVLFQWSTYYTSIFRLNTRPVRSTADKRKPALINLLTVYRVQEVDGVIMYSLIVYRHTDRHTGNLLVSCFGLYITNINTLIKNKLIKVHKPFFMGLRVTITEIYIHVRVRARMYVCGVRFCCMCMCAVCVCICMYMRACMYAVVHICGYVCMYVYVCACVYTFLCLFICMCVCLCVYVRVFVFLSVFVYVFVWACVG